MNSRMQTDAWISHAVLVLGLMLGASVVGVLILAITGQPTPEILLAFATVATTGLIQLWISPLNRDLLE